MFEGYLDKAGRLKHNAPAQIKPSILYTKPLLYTGLTTIIVSPVIRIVEQRFVLYAQNMGSFGKSPVITGKKSGCIKCGHNKIQKKLTNNYEEVLARFKDFHKDTYVYDNFVYVSMSEKVLVTCRVHGDFQVRPCDHEQGSGCPKCQGHNQTILYLLKCRFTGLTKIGITNNLKRRVQEIGGNISVLEAFTIDNPRLVETMLHDKYKALQTYNPHTRQGHTEFFNLSDAHIQEIKEILNK